MSVPCVLVLAGHDPSGGAGMLADCEAIRAIGARALAVPTALTVQTTLRVRKVHPVGTGYVLEAARALLAEEDVRAVKVGMLGTGLIAKAVFDLVKEIHDKRPELPVVLDPVLRSTSGAPLFRGTPAEARAAHMPLYPHVILTPNAVEAQLLLDLVKQPTNASEQVRAARLFTERGVRAALVKGGHTEGPQAIDVLAVGTKTTQLVSDRLIGKSARGTGCRLASALAAALAMGADLPTAAQKAKNLVLGYLNAQ
ncbi:MAG: hydroxymethylpyrimidine/phosphomethylpyrimidine kinase [Deltaproteobacteria bacterium]|nr:hydroxymethylpyrimidine/phosphomethylpyrimidine kinase [Deltaproteobacteria bacterium]